MRGGVSKSSINFAAVVALRLLLQSVCACAHSTQPAAQ